MIDWGDMPKEIEEYCKNYTEEDEIVDFFGRPTRKIVLDFLRDIKIDPPSFKSDLPRIRYFEAN